MSLWAVETARQTAPQPPPDRYYVGLDLGQSADYTALSIVRRVPPADWNPAEQSTDRPEGCRYEVVGLKRYRLGTPYPEIVEHVQQLLGQGPLAAPETMLTVDKTGVGAPVIDMFHRAGLWPKAITITGGKEPLRDGDDVSVPKRDLVSTLQVLLQGERLKIAAMLPEAETLRREFLNFRVKITLAANDTYGAWREGEHDDLVLSVALACWAGENLFDVVWRVL